MKAKLKIYIVTTAEKSEYVIRANNKREARKKFRARYSTLKIESITQQLKWTRAQLDLMEETVRQLERLNYAILHKYSLYSYAQKTRKLRSDLYTRILRLKFT